MTRIVITEFMNAESVDLLRERFEVVYDPKLADDRQRLLAELTEADGLIVRNRTQVDAELLGAAPALKIVGRLGVGLDNIDVAACEARDIKVAPAIGANAVAVAEYVIAAALHLVRGAFAATEQVIAGTWPRQSLMGGELAGRTLGLIGYGSIAREVARRASAFGMETVAFDPFLAPDDPAWGGARSLPLEELLSQADVISLHVPLTSGTKHIIDATAFARMKRNAILINTSRGGVVDETALVEALGAGRIGGAALDVFETEPMTAEAGAQFAGLPSLILTPHIAGLTDEANIRVSGTVAAAVSAALGDR